MLLYTVSSNDTYIFFIFEKMIFKDLVQMNSAKNKFRTNLYRTKCVPLGSSVYYYVPEGTVGWWISTVQTDI